MNHVPRVTRWIALLCLFNAPPLLYPQTTAIEKPSRSATSKADEDETNSSPRERGRILQKRNPIASEYQIFGELGTTPGSDFDGEGVDYRAFFPTANPFSGPSESLSFEYNLNYNRLSGNAESGGALSVKKTLGTEAKWVVAAQARSSASDRQIDHFEAVWQDAERLGLDAESLQDTVGDQPLYYLDRPRYSVDEIYTRNNLYTAQIARKLNENHTIYFKTYYQDYFDNSYRNRLELQYGRGTLSDPDSIDIENSVISEAAFEGAGARRYFGDTDSNRSRQHNILGGSYRGSDWTIDYSIYTHKWDIGRLWYNWNFNDFGLDLEYDLSDDTLAAYQSLDGSDTNNQEGARFSSLRIHDSSTSDEDLAWRVDGERKIKISDLDVWIQTGILHREKERDATEKRDVYGFNPDNLFYLSDVERTREREDIIDGQYLHQTGLDASAGASLLLTESDKFVLNDYRSKVESSPNFYDAYESVTSAYALGVTQIDRWTLEAGARFEQTETETNGTLVVPEKVNDPNEGQTIETIVNPFNGETEFIKTVAATNRYDNFLPSFEAAYRLSDSATLKAAWYRSLMRPQYFDIVNYRRISIPTRGVFEGNPNLSPTSIDKSRLAIDQDLGDLGSLSIEVYSIDIDSFFYGAVSKELILEDGNPVEYVVGRVENGIAARIRGYELQWQKQIEQALLWKNANVSLAYTYSDSEASVATRPNEILDVPSRSKHLLKASASGSIGSLSSSLNFGFQSEALDDIGARPEEDEYRERVISLSLSNRYKINDKTQVYLNLYNLLNHPERSYEGIPLKKLRNQYSDAYAMLGFIRSF